MNNKKVEPRSLQGFMELDPKSQLVFNRIKEIIENTFKKYSFWPLDTPIIEYSEVLLAKAGGETEKQIYRFNKGDNDLSLRFDLTVPLAKYVASRYNELTFPFKRFQIGKVFRGERPQKGRFREFYQCDIDVVGDEELSPYYDVEIPSVIYDLFKKLNVGDFLIKINNRKVLNGFFSSLDLKNYLEILRVIDKLDKIGDEAVVGELKNLGISEKKINKIIDFTKIKGTNKEIINKLKNMGIDSYEYDLGVKELEFVISNMLLKELNEDNYTIDLTIARGLDYYTGTVYETVFKDYPEIGSVCSGGRYDNLAEYYTDKKLPGVGISIGLTRLFDQLSESGLLTSFISPVAEAVIVCLDDNAYAYGYKIANTLRNNDIKTDMCYLNKIKSKMKYVNNIKAKYAIIIGEDEVNKEVVAVKDMEQGTQKTMTIQEFIKMIEK